MRNTREQDKNLPQELTKRPQWVRMRISRSPAGKLQKIPWNPYRPNELASVAKPNTWSTFAHVADTLKPGEHPAFALTKEDPYVFVDFDSCLEDGRIRRRNRQVYQEVVRLNSYSEVSVSGTGLHVVARGTLPVAGRKTTGLEMYQSSRFVLMTGTLFEKRGTIADRQEELTDLYQRAFPAREKKTRPAQVRLFTDEELLTRAFNARNGAKIRAVYAGDWQRYYNTQSEAEAALCCFLGFYSQNNEQIDRLYRRSKLFREKWDEVHFADGRTYGEATIDRALKRVDRTFAAEATIYRK